MFSSAKVTILIGGRSRNFTTKSSSPPMASGSVMNYSRVGSDGFEALA
jgi:hypothetical protein